MTSPITIVWPSEACKPVLGVLPNPDSLAKSVEAIIFRDKDDLDEFEGMYFQSPSLGPVLVVRYDNSPANMSVIHVDNAIDTTRAEVELICIFNLRAEEVAWRLSESK